MLLARMWDAMFDPEAKKKEMEKSKRQALERIQVPPLTGYHSKPGETVPISQVMTSNDTYWLNVFLENEEIRNRHGVSSVDGKWKITDQQLFDAKVDEAKRFLLRPHWKK